jgi:hypothetical protein
MTENKTKTDAAAKPFVPVKKQSPFVTDPFNTRGRKGGKGGLPAGATSHKGGKSVSMPKFKGGAGGDR